MNAHDIVDALPKGYRYATEVECDRWNHPAYFNKMVQVNSGIDYGDGVVNTDLAIQIRPGADVHDNLRAREGIDRCACGCKYWERDYCIGCGEHVLMTYEIVRIH